jgi:hypothetical protein
MKRNILILIAVVMGSSLAAPPVPSADRSLVLQDSQWSMLIRFQVRPFPHRLSIR